MTDKQETTEEDLQKKYMELQMLGKQIKQGQQQIELLDEQIESMSATISSLDDLKEAKKGSEMLSVLAEGLFIKSQLKDNTELIVNVGANVAVTKTIEETKELIKEKIQHGQSQRKRMLEELKSVIDFAKQTEAELTALVE